LQYTDANYKTTDLELYHVHILPMTVVYDSSQMAIELVLLTTRTPYINFTRILSKGVQVNSNV